MIKHCLKQVYKNPLIFIPLILTIIITISSLIMNTRASTFLADYRYNIVTDIEKTNALNTEIDVQLESQEIDNEVKEKLKLVKQNNSERIKLLSEQLNDYDNGEYSKSYEKAIKFAEADLKEAYLNSDEKSLTVSVVKRDLMIYQELAKEDIPYQSINIPQNGYSFMLDIWASKLPIFGVLSIIYILGFYLTGRYAKDKTDTFTLLPRRAKSVVKLNIVSSVLIAIATILLLLFVAFLVSSLYKGTGNLSFPYLVTDIDFSKPFPTVAPQILLPSTSSVMIGSFLLQLFGLIFISTVVYLISLYTREAFNTIVISAGAIIGLLIITQKIDILYSILHLFPITYLNSVDVASGQLALDTMNSSITLNNGLICLSICIAVMMIVILIKEKKGRSC